MEIPYYRGSPLLIRELLREIMYRKKPLTILQQQIPYYMRQPLTMEGKPLL